MIFQKYGFEYGDFQKNMQQYFNHVKLNVVVHTFPPTNIFIFSRVVLHMNIQYIMQQHFSQQKNIYFRPKVLPMHFSKNYATTFYFFTPRVLHIHFSKTYFVLFHTNGDTHDIVYENVVAC